MDQVTDAGAIGTIDVLDFYADWCAPCRRVSPLLAELANEFEREIRLVRINVDADSVMAEKHEVYSLPTVIFLRNKHEVDRIVGAKSKTQYRAAIIKSIKNDRKPPTGKRKIATR